MEMQKENLPRILGKYSGSKKGPLLFVTCAVHGNEPSGVDALQRVFKELKESKPAITGTIVGVVCNREALAMKTRYIDEDLNRAWTKENIEQKKTDTHEKKIMHEIIDVLEQFPEKDYTKRYFLDCHTTSAESPPFISVQEVGDNDTWAHYFPVHIVRGFSDLVYGCIDHYLSRTGLTGFVLEAGQHTSKASICNHEGMIWLALQEACGLDLHHIDSYPDCVQHLTKAITPPRKTFEIVYRHKLENEDDFSMLPGFTNFDPIKKGQLLGTQNEENIYSDYNGYIFMPLYQPQGDDGFFVVKEAD